MRIIAGEFRGRRLLDPADASTRPVTDRVKQRIFDVLGSRVADATVWDIFAGTGSFGLESLSRGAARVTFFERHRPAVVRLRRNIETLGVTDRTRLHVGDVFAVDATAQADGHDKADLVFFDPPYPLLQDRAADVSKLLERVAAAMDPGGLVVFRSPVRSEYEPTLGALDQRTWGSMRVRFLAASRRSDTPLD